MYLHLIEVLPVKSYVRRPRYRNPRKCREVIMAKGENLAPSVLQYWLPYLSNKVKWILIMMKMISILFHGNHFLTQLKGYVKIIIWMITSSQQQQKMEDNSKYWNLKLVVKVRSSDQLLALPLSSLHLFSLTKNSTLFDQEVLIFVKLNK